MCCHLNSYIFVIQKLVSQCCSFPRLSNTNLFFFWKVNIRPRFLQMCSKFEIQWIQIIKIKIWPVWQGLNFELNKSRSYWNYSFKMPVTIEDDLYQYYTWSDTLTQSYPKDGSFFCTGGNITRKLYTTRDVNNKMVMIHVASAWHKVVPWKKKIQNHWITV